MLDLIAELLPFFYISEAILAPAGLGPPLAGRILIYVHVPIDWHDLLRVEEAANLSFL